MHTICVIVFWLCFWKGEKSNNLHYLQKFLKFDLGKQFLEITLDAHHKVLKNSNFLPVFTGNQCLLGNRSVGIPLPQRQERVALLKL